MVAEKLKAEVCAASPEMRQELYTLLCALRRAQDPGRGQMLAARLDDPARWISEDEAARRLGLASDDAQ